MVEVIKNMVGESTDGIFPGWGNGKNFGSWGGLPSSSQQGKPFLVGEVFRNYFLSGRGVKCIT